MEYEKTHKLCTLEDWNLTLKDTKYIIFCFLFCVIFFHFFLVICFFMFFFYYFLFVCLFVCYKSYFSGSPMERYPCNNCDKVYLRISSRRRHEKYECGKGKLFNCLYCEKQVKQKYNLYLHVCRRHKEYVNDFKMTFFTNYLK